MGGSDAFHPPRIDPRDVTDDRTEGAADPNAEGAAECIADDAIFFSSSFFRTLAADAFAPTKSLKFRRRRRRLRYGAFGSFASLSLRSVSYNSCDTSVNKSAKASTDAVTFSSFVELSKNPVSGSFPIVSQIVLDNESVASTDCDTPGKSRNDCAPRLARKFRCKRTAWSKS